MKKVLMLTQFIDEPENSCNSRFTYLAELLCEQGFDVEIITSSFDHMSKSQKSTTIPPLPYHLIRIFEGGYPKNVCLKRFRSHAAFARNVKKYLKSSTVPDVVFCAVPSFDLGVIGAKYARRNRTPFIVDIQDLWPEAFKMVFCPPFADLFYLPFMRKENKVFKSADEIVAVSETYADRGLEVNKKGARGTSVYLGTELKRFDALKSGIEKKSDIFTLAYVGTLGHSYNLKGVIDALALLGEKGRKTAFKVMGDGPLKEEFERYAAERKVDCSFTGYLPYGAMVQELCACHVAVNCIVDRAAQSIVNKVGDYAAAALPVINTQRNAEYKNLLEKYRAGFSCDNSNIQDIAAKIEILADNESMREELGQGNRRMAEELFDRAVTYEHIVGVIKERIGEI